MPKPESSMRHTCAASQSKVLISSPFETVNPYHSIIHGTSVPNEKGYNNRFQSQSAQGLRFPAGFVTQRSLVPLRQTVLNAARVGL
eukprot:scaffold803_cov310-Pinguiococcus_pyrenoidosus.AAC.160